MYLQGPSCQVYWSCDRDRHVLSMCVGFIRSRTLDIRRSSRLNIRIRTRIRNMSRTRIRMRVRTRVSILRSLMFGTITRSSITTLIVMSNSSCLCRIISRLFSIRIRIMVLCL